MSFIVIIPARYESSRLPGKPLVNIDGKPMIQHVYEKAAASKASEIIVATDDDRVVSVVESFGGKVCMTSLEHNSGTDRIEEVTRLFQLDDGDIVVNVQGDEPGIPPEVINQVAYNLEQSSYASVATLSEPITDQVQFENANVVKVVKDSNDKALYFSRAIIPFARDISFTELMESDSCPHKHIGIYAYRVKLLHDFVNWPASPLELVEKLEQLRVLYNGNDICVHTACQPVPGGIDTPEDLETYLNG